MLHLTKVGQMLTRAWHNLTNFPIFSLFVDCLMGSWSDLFGRKMPMYLPSVGGLLATIVYIVVICFEEVGVGWLCLASLLSGAFGGFTSVIANSFAFVTSISENENRTLRYEMSINLLTDDVS